MEVTEIKIYKDGAWHSLRGQKIYSSGSWIVFTTGSGVYYNGNWYKLN